VKTASVASPGLFRPVSAVNMRHFRELLAETSRWAESREGAGTGSVSRLRTL